MGTSNPASLAGTHPAPPPMCEIEKGRLHDPPAWVWAHAADYSLRSFVMFFIDVTTCTFPNNIHDIHLIRRFQAKLYRVPAPLWSALTRAAPLRPCASLRVLPGAKGAGPLRNALGWLCLLFCCRMPRRVMHCLL